MKGRLGFIGAALIFTAACSSSSPPDLSSTSASNALNTDDAIARAEEWVAARLPYCQSPNHTPDGDKACSPICSRPDNPAWDPYRSDCSGLVSWAWGLPAPGRVTWQFAPFQNDITSAIDASELRAGDAVNNRDHVMLFKEWLVPNVTARFIEEPGCSSATPYAHELVSHVEISGSDIHVDANGMSFTAIRYGALTAGGGPPPPRTYYYQGLARDASGKGYWLVGSDGGVFSFGDAGFHGSTGNVKLNRPVVGMAATPSGDGYWLVASDGGVFAFGDAGFHGSAGAVPLNQPIVGMASAPDGNGYWLVASDGGVFSYGSAHFFGSTGAIKLNAPIVGMAAAKDGYWLVASDGGIFSFGADFYGSMGGKHLSAPVVGMAATPSGKGYWLVASDGGVFAFGDARFFGSMGGKPLNAPILGIAATPDGGGYWLVAGDGGVFTFGDATFAGSRG